MKNRTLSAKISLGFCIFFSAVLVVSLFTFPAFLQWFYVEYHHLNADNAAVIRNVRAIVATYYACAPFAAAALYMLIRLLLNVLHDDVFVMKNVTYLRGISWCCWGVAVASLVGCVFYVPLVIVFAAMGIMGALLRVVKNLVHSAVALREENELTI